MQMLNFLRGLPKKTDVTRECLGVGFFITPDYNSLVQI